MLVSNRQESTSNNDSTTSSKRIEDLFRSLSTIAQKRISCMKFLDEPNKNCSDKTKVLEEAKDLYQKKVLGEKDQNIQKSQAYIAKNYIKRDYSKRSIVKVEESVSSSKLLNSVNVSKLLKEKNAYFSKENGEFTKFKENGSYVNAPILRSNKTDLERNCIGKKIFEIKCIDQQSKRNGKQKKLIHSKISEQQKSNKKSPECKNTMNTYYLNMVKDFEYQPHHSSKLTFGSLLKSINRSKRDVQESQNKFGSYCNSPQIVKSLRRSPKQHRSRALKKQCHPNQSWIPHTSISHRIVIPKKDAHSQTHRYGREKRISEETAFSQITQEFVDGTHHHHSKFNGLPAHIRLLSAGLSTNLNSNLEDSEKAVSMFVERQNIEKKLKLSSNFTTSSSIANNLIDKSSKGSYLSFENYFEMKKDKVNGSKHQSNITAEIMSIDQEIAKRRLAQAERKQYFSKLQNA